MGESKLKQYKVTPSGYMHAWRWIRKLSDVNKHYHIRIWKTDRPRWTEHLCRLGWIKRDDIL